MAAKRVKIAHPSKTRGERSRNIAWLKAAAGTPAANNCIYKRIVWGRRDQFKSGHSRSNGNQPSRGSAPCVTRI